MKIAIAVEHFRKGVGGGENIALAVVKALRQRGHQVLVCAVSGYDDMDFLRISPKETPRAARDWGAELLIDWGIRLDADVHYLHGAPHKIFLEYALHATPSWLRWWKRWEFSLKGKHRKFVAEQDEFFLNERTAYLAVSHFVAGQVEAVTGSLRPDIRVLHNPVDTERFSPAVCDGLRGWMRRQLGIPDDAVVFVWVAHNARLKNLPLLLRIFPEIHRENPRVRLLVVGKRKPRKKAPWLVYAGALERTEEAYAAADGMLHPTFYDTFANVVAEAMACGLPVLCSDRAGAAEVMLGKDCGEVLPVVGKETERIWRTAILRLAADRVLRGRRGENGRAVATTLSFDGYVVRLEKEIARFVEWRRGKGKG